jgi:hypothetical protein
MLHLIGHLSSVEPRLEAAGLREKTFAKELKLTQAINMEPLIRMGTLRGAICLPREEGPTRCRTFSKN